VQRQVTPVGVYPSLSGLFSRGAQTDVDTGRPVPLNGRRVQRIHATESAAVQCSAVT